MLDTFLLPKRKHVHVIKESEIKISNIAGIKDRQKQIKLNMRVAH